MGKLKEGEIGDKNFIRILVVGVLLTFFIPLFALISEYILLMTLLLVVFWFWFIKFISQEIFKNKTRIRDDTVTELVQYLRKLRHDFVNHYQVLYGIAQISKDTRLLKHLEKVKILNNNYGSILKLSQYDLVQYFLKQLACQSDTESHYQLTNSASWEDFNNSYGPKIVPLLDRVCQLISLEKIVHPSSMIDWELDENTKEYTMVLTVYDSEEPWGVNIDKYLNEVKVEAHKIGVKFEYFTWEEQIAVHFLIPK
ncbi:Spo0B domain-containing protein [Natranaerobius trueperi]|nr:Spo0B domain-containing protein [Natranaerobius trueperi]